MSSKKNYEALLNEYKGNMFEFLVGHEFSKAFNLEQLYLDKTIQNIGSILEQQESFLRNYYPDLLIDLPLWAKELTKSFTEQYKLLGVTDINLVGKSLAAAGDDSFNEADLLIHTQDCILPLSIKLAKYGSYVNTKSAGAKSFLLKHFSPFLTDIPNLQVDFNKYWESEFDILAMQMHHEAGIEYLGGFTNWINEGLPTLPGELAPQFKTYLLSYYKRVNLKLYTILNELYLKDPDVFLASLWGLKGLSNSELIQVISFHRSHLKTKDGINIMINSKSQKQKYLEFKMNETNSEFVFEDSKLQLRLKPMNKFTSKSYKINCSVKYL